MATFNRGAKEYNFAKDTSHFGKNEHEALNIDLVKTDDFSLMMNHVLDNTVNINLSVTAQSILAANLSKQDILLFNPSKHADMAKDVILFYNKLRMVFFNNNQDMQVTRFESYIHEFAVHLFYCLELEDGHNFTMVPCNLELVIDNIRFAAYADREGRRGTKTIWVLDEDKHKFDTRYKDGIIQLVACLIAAAQRNRANHLNNRPTMLIGTLIKGYSLYMCSTNITDEYLDELTSGIPKNNIRLKVIVYPENNGLSFVDQEQRITIFRNLAGIREYGLTIQPAYDDL